MNKSRLKQLIKEAVKQEILSINNDDIQSATEAVEKEYNKDTNSTEGNRMDVVNMESKDLHEIMSRLGSDMTADEVDFLYKLNNGVKEVNPEASVFVDKDSQPGAVYFVIDAESMGYYVRVKATIDFEVFDVEIIKMSEAFKDTDGRLLKKFSDFIEDTKKFENVAYDEVMEVLKPLISPVENTLLENYRRMKRVLK